MRISFQIVFDLPWQFLGLNCDLGRNRLGFDPTFTRH